MRENEHFLLLFLNACNHSTALHCELWGINWQGAGLLGHQELFNGLRAMNFAPSVTVSCCFYLDRMRCLSLCQQSLITIRMRLA